ncbi:uncharacterized protein MKZ38_000421 [Zalerion maritima]|uniref:Methyltransferase n=1 Tax=Zalerion maritima TaxID=339359 RepID=A0AAD5S5P7_9PEZI|nr:uncharacterized protein MKZ38_000421 [Zalerion maritima]
MGGKKRRSKKHKHHHPTGIGHGPQSQLHPNGNGILINHLQQQELLDKHHDHDDHEQHSHHSGRNSSPEPDRDQDQEMIDATGEQSGVRLYNHGFRLKEMEDSEQHEVADTLSPLPEIKPEPPLHQDMDLDFAPVNTKSLPPEPRGSQSLPLDSHIPDLLAAEPPEPDDGSIYTPSHYPSISPRFKTERPFDSNTVTSSRSLWAEDLDYFWENGRRYCGNYFMPNDEEEQDRLRIIHQVYLSVFDLELTTVPLDDPTYILDIGTGTGEWAIGMGEEYENCEVVGTDISAIQPSAVPHNVFFEIDDAELEWTRPENCADLIHMRHMAGAFCDWEFIYQQAFNTLKPGGYIELLDFDDHKGLRNFFSFFPPDSEIISLTRDLTQASVMSGKPRGVTHLDPRCLIDAGFVDVTMSEHAVPLSPAEMSTGKLWLVACLCSLEALTMRLLTKYMGWTADRVRDVCDKVAEELKDVALNDPVRAREVVMKVRILVGRKPEVPEQWTAHSFHENGEAMLPESAEESST